jgi:hypothetical protein
LLPWLGPGRGQVQVLGPGWIAPVAPTTTQGPGPGLLSTRQRGLGVLTLDAVPQLQVRGERDGWCGHGHWHWQQWFKCTGAWWLGWRQSP